MQQWSPQQQKALDSVGDWLKQKDKQVFYLAGYAGTGKTTLAKYLADDVDGRVLFGAFTGKAASVLRSKGCTNARTLHSILYHAHIDSKGKLVFSLNPDSVLKSAKLLILDECSMVNEELGEDVLGFNVPVLVLGDPAQLPPISGMGFFTKRTPDQFLTEVHRQAKDNPIIQLASAIREGREEAIQNTPEIRYLNQSEADMKELAMSHIDLDTQILVGKHVSRRSLNKAIRRTQGYESDYPEEGEKLVILKNDHKIGVLNGVTCTTTSATKEGFRSISCDVDYEDQLLEDLSLDKTPFDIYTEPSLESSYNPFTKERRDFVAADWGYAITVHKAQGSEWKSVLLIDDRFGLWDRKLRRQWLYTAVTRAVENLTIVKFNS